MSDGQGWKLRDYAKKIPWNGLKTYQRVFEMLMGIFEFVEMGDLKSATAPWHRPCRTEKLCTERRWTEHAWMLTVLVDPCRNKRWGGEEDELEIINTYAKTDEDLEKRYRSPGIRSPTKPPQSRVENRRGR